jgi:hypothetical protein
MYCRSVNATRGQITQAEFFPILKWWEKGKFVPERWLYLSMRNPSDQIYRSLPLLFLENDIKTPDLLILKIQK